MTVICNDGILNRIRKISVKRISCFVWKRKSMTRKAPRGIRDERRQSVAEGVKTEEQPEAVKRIGFRKVQGYYFDVPIPIADFEKKYLKTGGTFGV